MNNKDTEAPARSYKDHLREQITNAEEATGYLSACYAEGPETFALAVKDVWEFARVDPPAAPTGASACSCCDHPTGFLPAVPEDGKWLHQGRDSIEVCTATPRKCEHCGTEKTSPECWNCGQFDTAPVTAPPAPDEADKALAQQILKKISEATLELAFVRHDLTSDEVILDDDADVKTRVAANEEFLERLKEDTLNCLTGDDTGCLDPEELDESNCELIWLTAALAQARKDQREADAQIVDAVVAHLAEVTAILSKHLGSAAVGEQWLPIETAPRDGTRILVGRPDYVWQDEWWKGDGTNSNWGDLATWEHKTGKVANQPTHWMPLPSAPAATPTSTQT